MKEKIICIFLILLISGCIPTGKVVYSEESKNFTRDLASKIRELPKIDITTIKTHKDLEENIKNINRLLIIANEQFETSFPLIKITDKNLNSALKLIQKYTPLINSYNGIIDSSNNLGIENFESVKEFYFDIAFLGVEAFLISSGTIHKISFKLVGTVAGNLGLINIGRIIGYKTYGVFLGVFYNYIRTNLMEFITNLNS